MRYRVFLVLITMFLVYLASGLSRSRVGNKKFAQENYSLHPERQQPAQNQDDIHHHKKSPPLPISPTTGYAITGNRKSPTDRKRFPLTDPKPEEPSQQRDFAGRVEGQDHHVVTAQLGNHTDIPVGRTRVKLDPMTSLRGGRFRMGVNDKYSLTGEFPVRWTEIRAFSIDRYPVTNGDFAKFKRSKMKYVTTAEKKGFSWVFFTQATNDSLLRLKEYKLQDAPWWFAIKEAQWRKPYGGDEGISHRSTFPVIHVSKRDAEAFCIWAGKRLPSEEEWEFAVRGGLRSARYPWGDSFQTNRSNVWQGIFPQENNGMDGWIGLSPVHSYPPQNEFGMYDMVGNAWEWTSTLYTGLKGKNITAEDKGKFVLKGGSFVDSKDGRVNLEARCSARKPLFADYTAGNIGFRCAKNVKILKKKPKEKPKVAQRKSRIHTREETWQHKMKLEKRSILGLRSGIYKRHRRIEL